MSHPSSTPKTLSDHEVLAGVARRAEVLGVFGPASVSGSRLDLGALASSEPASYRFELEADAASVSLVTPARYLSQSIEADLVHSGDKLADLLSDELLEVGYDGPPLSVEHFRDRQKLFTFLTRLPGPPSVLRTTAGVDMACKVLQAYEACFRELGDMSAGEKE